MKRHKMMTCVRCGEQCERTNSRQKRCRGCALIRARERNRGYYVPRPRQPRLCTVCGREYKPNSGNQKICSSECAEKVRRERSSQWYVVHAEKVRENRKRSYWANPEKARSASRRWQALNREKAKKTKRRRVERQAAALKLLESMNVPMELIDDLVV